MPPNTLKWEPIIPRRPPEPVTRPDGTPRVYGPYLARLDCGHILAPGKDYRGEVAYVGDTVRCVLCAGEAAKAEVERRRAEAAEAGVDVVPDAPPDAIPIPPQPAPERQVVDVVAAAIQRVNGRA